MQGDTVEVDAIADAYGALTEYLLSIAERNHGVHLPVEATAEQLVDLKAKAHLPFEILELGIVWIGGYLGDSPHTCLAQAAEEADKPRIGILETAGIDKLDAFLQTVVVDTAVVQALTQSRQSTCSIVGYDTAVDKTAAVAVGGEVVIAETHIIAVLAKAFHLIVDFLGNSAMLGKTVIDKEQNSHVLCLYYCVLT